MPSPIVTASLQAAGLSALSNIIGQVLTSYQTDEPFVLDFIQLLQFVVFTLISCPPNIRWQEYLERVFPGYVQARPALGKDSEKKVLTEDNKKFSVENTAKKFFLDQTLGSLFNTTAFIVGMGFLKGKDMSMLISDVQNNFWPMVTSGLKFWPLVSLFNFAVVPVEKRVIVGGLAGVVWGIYLTMMVAT